MNKFGGLKYGKSARITIFTEESLTNLVTESSNQVFTRFA